MTCSRAKRTLERHEQSFCRRALPVLLALACALGWRSTCSAGDAIEFFERKIRPILVEHCYPCHSAQSKELQGGLRLDLKAGWEQGGDSGLPAIVRGRPDESPLMWAVQHVESVSAMPPKKPRLPASVIADLSTWIQTGAADPRLGDMVKPDKLADWEAEFRNRLAWWSLQPVAAPEIPDVLSHQWSRSAADRFILAELEANGLESVDEADPATLARRLSYALLGLPPDVETVRDLFTADDSPAAYDKLVDRLLASPQFGQHWARHWMDVVHYSDTHGYEWDVPVKNAWMYRDYLIRAFNADVPYRQLVLEQIAGDLLPPRIDSELGVNESLIAPMMLRLGERRHGDNSAIEGVSQEAVANMIDTLGKAFLGTTLACAQCHDHKLDAVEQRDYYSLAGMLMSTRYTARPIDAVDPNTAVLAELRTVKQLLRKELASLWRCAVDPSNPSGALEKLKAISADGKLAEAKNFPTLLAEFWRRSQKSPISEDAFFVERAGRLEANKKNLTLLADFTREGEAGGWRWQGWGMQHGLVDDGEMVIADEGETVLEHLLPAGRFSHVWSQRLAGSLQSPELDPTDPVTFSFEAASGRFASQSFIVDRAINPERLTFAKSSKLSWRTVTAGNFDSLEGTPDNAARRVYFELATKSLNNYFPPRVGYGGVSETEVADPRSWFGITRIFRHAPGHGPQDELGRFVPLFTELKHEPDWARRLVELLSKAVERWADSACDSEDVRLINEALELKLLPNELSASLHAEQLVARWRSLEQTLQPDRTVGSADQWAEGRDERIGIRGSYTDLGQPVPRGVVRFLEPPLSGAEAGSHEPGSHEPGSHEPGSGRLGWARRVAHADNPLTARVYVNRVWHYLHGEGLVRTTDDFGHLGDQPRHRLLLDHLARRFVEEGWSTKRLIRELVTSATWRQASTPRPLAVQADPENRLWHHMPMRRLEAEAIRDSILTVSGRLDRAQFGPPIEPYRTAEDSQKRLFAGPLDGLGRRSIYLEMTLMEMPRFLALFNQPLPKQTVGRRDVTNVPDQALALLNDPFVIEMAAQWSSALMVDGSQGCEERAATMLESALARPPLPEEVARLVRLVQVSAELRGYNGDVIACPAAWQDAAHAIFNLKEFLYVR